MTSTTWVDDSGFLSGPVMITNTHSVGVVRDAVVAWKVKRGSPDMEGYWWSLPVVAKPGDGYPQRHQRIPREARRRLARTCTAHTEGNVGGGTGMICNEFKGGIGTDSRVLDAKFGSYTIGVLVQCNYGSREQLRIAGVNVRARDSRAHRLARRRRSIIVVLATNAGRSSPPNSSASPEDFRSASAVTAAIPATARATSSSPSLPRIRARSALGVTPAHHAPQRLLDPIFLTGCAGHRRSRRQRHGCRRNHGHQRSRSHRTPSTASREHRKKYSRLANKKRVPHISRPLRDVGIFDSCLTLDF